MPSFRNWRAVRGFRQRLHPPTMAASQCPCLMLFTAWSRAKRLEEQAVSRAKLGPTGQKVVLCNRMYKH